MVKLNPAPKGFRSGKLEALGERKKGNKNILEKCICDCGQETWVPRPRLLNGKSKSCGKCIKKQLGVIIKKGEKIGRLIILGEQERIKGKICEKCLCSCGTVKWIPRDNLYSTKSCGCLYKENSIKQITRVNNLKLNGYIHGKSRTRIYNIYKCMRSRCENKNNNRYYVYGGRGIQICDRRKKFENFYKDMYPSYLKHVEEYGEKNTTIDRIDVDGNYCKENCRWATYSEQNNNKR